MEGSTLFSQHRKSWALYALLGIVLTMVLAAVSTPNLLRSRMAATPMYKTDLRREFMSNMQSGSATVRAIALEPGTVQAAPLDRKVVRKGTLDLMVGSPSSALDDINAIAHRHNGYVVSSELTGRQESQRGTITIRVPAAQFDTAREELKKLAKRVESEQTFADDITMQYSENEATVRNFRAEEASYLEIMKRTGAIKDTLQVAQQLSDVRGRIERMEAQVRTMAMESEMSAIQVTVSAEPMVLAGQRWRPLYELQAAWNSGMDALTTYATAMMAILMYLPAVLAWTLTLILGAKLSWMLLRRGWRWVSPEKSAATLS